MAENENIEEEELWSLSFPFRHTLTESCSLTECKDKEMGGGGARKFCSFGQNVQDKYCSIIHLISLPLRLGDDQHSDVSNVHYR